MLSTLTHTSTHRHTHTHPQAHAPNQSLNHTTYCFVFVIATDAFLASCLYTIYVLFLRIKIYVLSRFQWSDLAMLVCLLGFSFLSFSLRTTMCRLVIVVV